jgi:hypothetical protein
MVAAPDARAIRGAQDFLSAAAVYDGECLTDSRAVLQVAH